VETTRSRRGNQPRPLGGRRFGLLLALAAILLVGIIGWLSLTGRLAGLQYANVPIVHPYPPAGYVVNPFTGDARDLVKASDAQRVKSDLLRDGDLQLAALAQGSTAALPQTATGNYLAKLNQTVAANNAQGVVYREQHHLDSVVVGRLPDPNATTSIVWCVEERGSGQSAYVSKSNGQTLSSYRFRSQAKFWLTRVGDRCLVADADVSVTRES
jgi:hypothetical protein